MKLRTATLVPFALVLPLALSACGSSDDSAGGSSTAPQPSSSSAMSSSAPASSTSSSSEAMSSSAGAMDAAKPFGPGCAAVPKDGKGSFSGMSADPVATAASNNPALSTLVTAVKKAGLVDTLNTADGITVFAPTNDAFAKIPKADLDKVLADKATLTKILTGHVTKPRLAPEKVAGTHTSLSGSTISVTGSGEKFTVDKNASVVCGNVQTRNATVYIIDSVLMPAS